MSRPATFIAIMLLFPCASCEMRMEANPKSGQRSSQATTGGKMDYEKGIGEFTRKAHFIYSAAHTFNVDFSRFPLPRYYFQGEEFVPDYYERYKHSAAWVTGDEVFPFPANLPRDGGDGSALQVTSLWDLRDGGPIHRYYTRSADESGDGDFRDPFAPEQDLESLLMATDYRVVSVGPDGRMDLPVKEIGSWEDLSTHVDSLYDPSNGTASDGDLVFPSFATRISPDPWGKK